MNKHAGRLHSQAAGVFVSCAENPPGPAERLALTDKK